MTNTYKCKDNAPDVIISHDGSDITITQNEAEIYFFSARDARAFARAILKEITE